MLAEARDGTFSYGEELGAVNKFLRALQTAGNCSNTAYESCDISYTDPQLPAAFTGAFKPCVFVNSTHVMLKCSQERGTQVT